MISNFIDSDIEPADLETAERNWKTWTAKLASMEEAKGASNLTDRSGPFGKLLFHIFGFSPFLTQLAFRHPEIVDLALNAGAEHALNAVLDDISHLETKSDRVEPARKSLRIAKQKIALITGLADISGTWDVMAVCSALTQFADAATRAAVSMAFEATFADLPPSDPKSSWQGFVVLAMGKMGAFELNYSSDIDLIVLFDRDKLPVHPRLDPQPLAVAITRHMVASLQDRTSDGYVFRTDLRLRPDPGSTAVAVSVNAALSYYESYGQNWERSAMIKARPAAGDTELGTYFLEQLRPFIWRKSMDFYALADIHSIKRQIHVHKGSATISVEGHNIKLGRGGIREIELFVQIQQLIWGGRHPELRTRGTLDGLNTLTTLGLVSSEEAQDLSAAYQFLRRVEHVLQMRLDEQTHSLPDDAAKVEAVARFLGYENREAFGRDLVSHMRKVETHYADLFEDSESLAPEGNLVFAGTEDDPDTLSTLHAMGFQDPSRIAGLVRSWHTGRMRATRSARAREILTELVPNLLTAFSKTARPDEAVIRFDTCLNGLPAGVQLFSLLQSNPELLGYVADIMGNSPLLADQVSKRPELFEYIITPAFDTDACTFEFFDAELSRKESGLTYEIWLDVIRQWFNEHKFRIGVRLLDQTLKPLEAQRQLSDAAEVALRHMMDRVTREYASQQDSALAAPTAIVAYGKLGTRELTPTSDLDVVFIYDSNTLKASSPNASLPAPAYYTRFVQRLITAANALTRQGRLFELDFRLRPDGDSGPLATSWDAFQSYQVESAWTWEHQALVKARPVWGEAGLCKRISNLRHSVLERPVDPQKIRKDATEMRRRVATRFKATDWLDIKYRRGGMLDLEFLQESLQLIHAPSLPGLIDTAPCDTAMALVKTGEISESEAHALCDAREFWLAFLTMQRFTLGDNVKPDDVPAGLRSRIAKALNLSDFAAVKDQAQAHADTICAMLAKHIDPEFGSES